jgi:hypothetical protein
MNTLPAWAPFGSPPRSATGSSSGERLFSAPWASANRLDDAMQAKILEVVHARVPMPTQDEQRALQLDHAQQHERAWRMRHLRTEATVEENKVRLKSAQRLVTEGEPLVTVAAEELKAAEERRGRIERGENVPLAGKPPSLKVLLKELGISPANARYMIDFHESLGAENIDRFVEWSVRRDNKLRRRRAELRAFLASDRPK